METQFPLDVRLVDGRGSLRRAVVNQFGQLVTGPLEPDDAVFRELAEIDTAYNFYPPRAHGRFFVSRIIMQGDQQVAANTNATVTVYEASSLTSTTVDKQILQIEVARNQSPPIPPLNFLVAEGKFVNAKTDDDDIHMTIMGYHVLAAPSL